MRKSKFFVFVVVFLVFVSLAFADDQYKPYLHKASVPESPEAKLYGKYSTNLFPGAGTYTYEIEVPRGTNNLQPSLTVSYNSQAVKQRPSFLGAGWTLPQSYIFRDVNFTPGNRSNDMFKLILNGVSYDLVYDDKDKFFHTETETFAKIENFSGVANSNNMYWLLTLKDGIKLRFGHNSTSELTSNVGYNYTLKWSLDQIEDTHNNRISYSYLEDPYPEDTGSVYLQQILYNNDEKRRIEFGYESSNRPDRRLVYDQGNVLEESRRLDSINIYFNDTLIRKYNFSYENLSSSVSSLSKIKYFGFDNTSLHTVTLGYHESTSNYYNSTFNSFFNFSDVSGVDNGMRFVDLNNDGFIDILQGREGVTSKSGWINNKTGWNETEDFAPPVFFVNGDGDDEGLRIVDLNNDGFPDLVQGIQGVRRAWLHNFSKWEKDLLTWPIPVDFVDIDGDQGTRLVDMNGDGLTDILRARDGDTNKAYLNTGQGWKDVTNSWIIPEFFTQNDGNDFGTRTADVNGDGLVDIIVGYDRGGVTKRGWLNNGSGWVRSNMWDPPTVFTSLTTADHGTRLVDLNQDGLVDIFVDEHEGQKSAWLNNGSGWILSPDWQSPELFTVNSKNIGRRISDVNGDGLPDIIIGSAINPEYQTILRNTTTPFLLKNITNEFGGITDISYVTSTIFNNTGQDGISDIGFNIWVVGNVLQDNSIGEEDLNELFNSLSNTSYVYSGGIYDHNDSEFRGFNVVNETLADNSIVVHYFHQSDALKGKEFKTETYDSSDNIFSKTENNYNITIRNGNESDYFIIHLDSTSTSLFDGSSANPKITNVSYKYDNYSNVISKTSFGDISISGDEKYENYTFIYNHSLNILDKVSKYQLFDENYNKLRETKYYYDNKLVGLTKGDLTKQEEWLDDETGNPVTYFNYDDFGNPYRQTDALGHTIVYNYGSKDSTNTYPDRRINELGHAVDYEYDVGTGNILSFTKHGVTFLHEYDTFGRISKDIQPYDTPTFPTKEYTYDFDGIAPEIIKVSQKTTSNNTLDTYYIYDGFANLVQIKTPSEDGQQVVKNIFYDGLFRVQEEQNPYFDTSSTTISDVSNTTNTTKYNYDTLSRIKLVVNPDGTIKNTTYDHWNITDIDENQNKKEYILDAYERIIEVKEFNKDFYIGDNQTYNTTYSYNGADELIGIRDNEGNEFNFTYNSLGQKIQLDDPDLGTWKYGYDFAGNLIKQTDNKENQIVMGYDGLNRIKHKNTTSQTFTFAYDKQYQGTLSNLSYDNITYTYTYDDRLRNTKEVLNIRHHTFDTGLTYDSMDRIIETRLPDSDDFDYYYNLQAKLHRVPGYINKSEYNPFGNPLNRSYFNTKLTEYDYFTDHARLKQIKTDTTQDLNYSYDSVGNVLEIDDSANNRLYSMSYDNLDRLTNVSIGEFKWVYSYNSIGNMLKIVRNHSKTTFLKYLGPTAHFPSKIITTDTGVDVYRESLVESSDKSKQVQFYLVNERNITLENINWTVEFGDGNKISAGAAINLTKQNFVNVIVNHTYTKGGNYKVNVTGFNGSGLDYETINLLFGAAAKDISIIKKNATLIISEFLIKNDNNNFSTNWGWNCSNGVFSTVDFNMTADEEAFVIMEHNYSLSSLSHNLTCVVNSTDGNQSLTLPFEFNNIEVENYNSSLKGESGIEVQFQIKNYFGTLNVSWNITASDQVIQSSAPITLMQGQTTSITQEINFTTRGVKPLKITVYSGNFTDTYSENIRLYSLDILDFLNIIKNGTTRIFNFIIENTWVDLTAYWNVSDPVVENTVNLSNNESLIVVIEEDYGQGKKEVEVKLYNQTVLEDSVIEVFTIKEIGINEFETLHQNNSWAVTSALVVNNIEFQNISWQLNNSQELIEAHGLELNASDTAFIVVESNFSESGIYPLNFVINSSDKNDNQTGVAVS